MNNTSEPKPITDFRVLPTVVFRCPMCAVPIQIVRSLPDIITTGYTCGCGASYRVLWADTFDAIRVVQFDGSWA